MQQVRELGHLPKETQSKPQEQLLTRDLRKARAAGLMTAHEAELESIAAEHEHRRAIVAATERKGPLEAF